MQVAQFIHGNRLERLADRLVEDLAAAGCADPLQPHVVVVAHPALGRWLQERIAARCGIAANIEFPLPSTFAWDILRELAGNLPRESAFSRDALAWRIFAALPGFATQPEFARVGRYLGTGGDQRQRLELATVLARTYDEYTMARPEWIRGWLRGRSAFDAGTEIDEAWQAELWRHLAGSVGEADRASLMQRVLAALADPGALPARLRDGFSVFGASHLPPLLLEFFLGLAQRLPLRFYQPNPCLDYWGDITSEREIARRRRLWNAHGRRGDVAHLETGHPLLASWGGLGREYLKAIHAPELVVHDDDAFVMPSPTSLLGWLQGGILLLDPNHAEPPPPEPAPSIQLHGCPSRRREIEVLRDELLRLIDQGNDLQPHDIVVMSPRIGDYAPYIAAVFGDPDDELSIPYGISDVPLRATHPLIDAFVRILDLGESRFAVSEVLGLLAEPAIARRHGLDGEAQDWLREWIADSGIRWGLDAGFRAALGAAAIDENTWRFGFNRLLLGYASGDDAVMPGGVVPSLNVEGGSAQWLGRLAQFVDLLADTRRDLDRERSAGEWKRWLVERLERLFDTESTDNAELAAIRDLREAIASFGDGAAHWLGEEALAFAVVRSALDAQIAEPRAARAGRFGITFCGMVPMRNVPHRVVCVLGLDAGEFPRRQPPVGFNLMRRHARPGDRSIREDDRFLFFESLVAARDVFYMSHVDRDPRSGGANPPSPLVEELTGFLAAAYGEAEWARVKPVIVRRHAMHPFAPDYFRAGSPTASYDRRWWEAACKLVEGWIEPAPFVAADVDFATAHANAAAELESATDWTELTIDQLLGWLGHPARAFFRQQFPLHLHEAGRDEDVEAFTLDSLTRYQLADRLLGPPAARPDLVRVRREGRFPLGAPGDQAWQELGDEVAALEQAAAGLPGGPFVALPGEPLTAEFASLRLRLAGVPRHRVGAASGREALLLCRPGRVRGVDLARLALERALLPAAAGETAAYAIGLDRPAVEAVQLQPLADLEGWLRALLLWRMLGLQHPLPAFSKSAEAYAASMQRWMDPTRAQLAASRRWGEGEFAESADPHNALIARHRADLVPGEVFELFAMQLFFPLFNACTEAVV